MQRLQLALIVTAVVLACGIAASEAQAGARTIPGGHPYHQGHLFIPPASAYQAVRLRAPIQFGVPAYYYPGSYLQIPADQPWGRPPADYYYGNLPFSRAGGYYMSANGAMYAYPW